MSAPNPVAAAAAAKKKAEGVGRNRRLSLTAAAVNKVPEGGVAKISLNEDNQGPALRETEAIGGYEFAVVTQAGHEPDGLKKTNQDSYIVMPSVSPEGNAGCCFGVFDGHGSVGHQVSGFIREFMPKNLPVPKLVAAKDKKTHIKIMEDWFALTNKELNKQDIDCSLSGTTAVVSLVKDGMVYTSNLGDSRSVIGRKEGSKLVAINLSDDQKPERPDECERVKRAGGRCEPLMDMGEPIGPGRVWLKHMMLPGLAMTRSFGDLVAESVGVVPEPETLVHEISPADEFMILASDGVWEFITSDEACLLIEKCKTPQEAAKILVDESSARWRAEEDVMDDITCTVVFLARKAS